MPTQTISRLNLIAQPVLCVRRRIERYEIAALLTESYGSIFRYLRKAGVMAGRPYARYLDIGPGLWTIEAGLPVSAAVAGEGDIVATLLPGGPAVVGVHLGPYEQLPRTYAAIERWIESNSLRAEEAPWESYITDPSELPDSSQWRTDVYWPLAQ